MSKITRLEQIARGKDVVDAQVELRTRRVTRTLEASIDAAEESALEEDAKAQEVLDNLYKNANSVESLKNAFNDYAEHLDNADSYRRTQEYFKQLKERLNEEVEVEDKKKD